MNTGDTTSRVRPRPLEEVLAGQPSAFAVSPERLAAAVASGRRVIVLDDDPTGTQTVAGLPVLTRWSVGDLRWALAQDAPAVFVLVNTRGMPAADAAGRDREVVLAALEAAAAEGVEVVFASRSDSTLRGHFPLETDIITTTLNDRAATRTDGWVDDRVDGRTDSRTGGKVDAVVLAPAYIDAGRVTVGGEHWLRTAEGMLPVGESEFARDATFGYRASALPAWVEEKTGGAIPRHEVPVITLRDLRSGDLPALVARLTSLTGGRPVAVDAACDDDLRMLTLALVEAERLGKTFVYRVGPSFVRSRSGQAAAPPVDDARLRSLTGPATAHGLVVVGSHVAQTTRQLDRLRARRPIALVELDSQRLLDAVGANATLDAVRTDAVRTDAVRTDAIGTDSVRTDSVRTDAIGTDVSADAGANATGAGRGGGSGDYLGEVVEQVVGLLATGEVVLSTSRVLLTAGSGEASLALSRAISAGVVSVVRGVTARVRPSFVVAKGGITSSDVATDGLGIVRARVVGTLLPGIVSLWAAAEGRSAGLPYVVFAGNVGDDEALADVVDRLTTDHPESDRTESDRPGADRTEVDRLREE